MKNYKTEQYAEYHESLYSLLGAGAAFTCDWCGETYDNDYGDPKNHEGDTICRFCAKDYYEVCDWCGTIHDKGKVCPECAELKKREQRYGENRGGRQ